VKAQDSADLPKAVNNITSYFDKLSECFLRLSNYCPRYTEYQLLFKESTRLQEALCSFYTTIIQFCTKAIRIVEAPGGSSWAELRGWLIKHRRSKPCQVAMEAI
jgi:hypothetical protein